MSSACDASDHLGRKHLFRVHGIERVLAVAEFASDFHRAALIYDGVNFVVADEAVVFRTAEGGLMGDAADWGRDVAFQADRIEEALKWGWSVLLQGQLSRVSDEEAEQLFTAVTPWAAGERHVVGRISADRISGRRLGDAS